MVTKRLLEKIQRVPFGSPHQEHEVGGVFPIHGEQIDRQRHQGKAGEQGKAFWQLAQIGADLAAHGQDQRIGGKQDMYGKAVNVHKV